MTRQARLTKEMQRLTEMDRHKVVHVIPDRNRWVVRRERAKRATRILSDREQAIDLARALARQTNGEVIVHRKDGSMQEWQVASGGHLQTVYTYGGPPSPREI
ncbi:MAG TPA: DUF2188 domain-containing protein [Thermoanaerobaculia bacterium]|nr:DUF2188 domain-containing protein [Thermoanaerobaculia bacterium]